MTAAVLNVGQYILNISVMENWMSFFTTTVVFILLIKECETQAPDRKFKIQLCQIIFININKLLYTTNASSHFTCKVGLLINSASSSCIFNNLYQYHIHIHSAPDNLCICILI